MIGWVLLIGLLLACIVWRHQIWSYVRGGPYLSTRLRRHINQTIKMRPTTLVVEDSQREQWAADICGAVPVSLSKFMSEPVGTESVLSVINERPLDHDVRQAFYDKLGTVPQVIRVRGQLASVAGDTSEFDDTGRVQKLTGNVVIEHEAITAKLPNVLNKNYDTS
jgi:hypothetical protein